MGITGTFLLSFFGFNASRFSNKAVPVRKLNSEHIASENVVIVSNMLFLHRTLLDVKVESCDKDLPTADMTYTSSRSTRSFRRTSNSDIHKLYRREEKLMYTTKIVLFIFYIFINAVSQKSSASLKLCAASQRYTSASHTAADRAAAEREYQSAAGSKWCLCSAAALSAALLLCCSAALLLCCSVCVCVCWLESIRE